MNMNVTETWTQAYKQTPWRKQMQVIGVFSAMVVFVGLVAGVYLSVTAQATSIGRGIQDMQLNMQEIQRNIVSMETRLAKLTSAHTMSMRAEEMGFEIIRPETPLYIVVSNYGGRDTVQLAPPALPNYASLSNLPPEYTLSIIEWMKTAVNQFGVAGEAQGGSQ